jgi:hypothetical protein
MSLLQETLDALNRHGLRSAVIGATAMAAHGVARATMDIDLLLVGRSALDSPAWAEMSIVGVAVDVRKGGPDDPLEGVVRLCREPEASIDVIVGAEPWQQRAIDRAETAELFGVRAPIATAVDLILLKLYAGSPQDRWDIVRLLRSSNAVELTGRVAAEVPLLPTDCLELWESIMRASD